MKEALVLCGRKQGDIHRQLLRAVTVEVIDKPNLLFAQCMAYDSSVVLISWTHSQPGFSSFVDTSVMCGILKRRRTANAPSPLLMLAAQAMELQAAHWDHCVLF